MVQDNTWQGYINKQNITTLGRYQPFYGHGQAGARVRHPVG